MLHLYYNLYSVNVHSLIFHLLIKGNHNIHLNKYLIIKVSYNVVKQYENICNLTKYVYLHLI